MPVHGTDIFFGGTIGPAIRVRDMGPETAYAEGVWRIPPYGGLQADGTETAEGTGQRLGLTPYEVCDDRGEFSGGGELRLPLPEHRGAIYCEYAHYGTVSGGEAEARAKSENAVVRTGGSGFGGDSDGGLGGRAGGWGGEDGRDGNCNGQLIKWG